MCASEVKTPSPLFTNIGGDRREFAAGCERMCGEFYGGAEVESVESDAPSVWDQADRLSKVYLAEEGIQGRSGISTLFGLYPDVVPSAHSCRESPTYPFCWEHKCDKIYGDNCPDKWPACACRFFSPKSSSPLWDCVKPGCEGGKPMPKCSHTSCITGTGGS